MEGCVRETLGVLVAHWQSRVARDPRARCIMATIARDEAQHAALAWRIASWALTRFSPRSRVHLIDVRVAASQALDVELAASPPHPDVVDQLGVPSAANVRRLLAAMRTLRLAA